MSMGTVRSARRAAGSVPRIGTLLLAGWLVCGVLGIDSAHAQGRRGAAPAPPPNARAAAPFDPSGDWVSLVTESWRFRMLVPGKGDYDEIPLSLAAKQFADLWSPTADEASGQQCKAYGAAALLWLPTRLHISWADDDTLRVDTDAGTQTRLLRFKPTAEEGGRPPSLQGLSVAEWVLHQGGGFGAQPQGMSSHYGYIKAKTDHMLSGYLRKNGVPYSDKTTMTEYWEQHSAPDGSQYLIVTATLHDPVYLQDPYVFSANFRKEPDSSHWHPTPCTLR
jgi:hypothetical protein